MKTHNIEQKSEEWLQIRKGKITGTTLKGIMGTPKARQESLYELIAERLTLGVETDYENPMDRGNRLEPDAIAIFELETGKVVDRIGFCESEDNSAITNSPDGLIGENEAIEVKCLGGKNYVKMWFTNEIPDDYYWQSIQYFVVNEKLRTLYFVGYNPDIPSHPIHIMEMKREDNITDIALAKNKQIAFLQEAEALLSTIIKI